MPFVPFRRGSFASHIGDHLWFGIICGPIWGSLPVWDHLRSNLGIIASLGSFAALYSSSVKVGFTDITLSILEKFQSPYLFEDLVSAVREIEHAKATKASWVLLRYLFIF